MSEIKERESVYSSLGEPLPMLHVVFFRIRMTTRIL